MTLRMCSTEYTLLDLDHLFVLRALGKGGAVQEEPIFLERSASLKLDTDIGEIQMRRKRNLMEKGDGVDGGDRGKGEEGCEGCGHWGSGRRRN